MVLIVKPGYESTGIGRYAMTLEKGLVDAGCQVSRVYPKLPVSKRIAKLLKKIFGWDLVAFFNNYPILINYPTADIYHFTSQNLASLLMLHKPRGKVIVTVHDIIPQVFQDDPEINHHQNLIEKFFNKLSLLGLKGAHGIITVSVHTRKILIDHLNYSADSIWPIYHGK